MSTCPKCQTWDRFCKCDGKPIQDEARDKLYEFVDVNTTGKPIEFRSKGQWKRHLKKLGMHDDCKQSVRSRDEVMNSFEKKSRFKPVDREERKKDILNIYDQIRRSR